MDEKRLAVGEISTHERFSVVGYTYHMMNFYTALTHTVSYRTAITIPQLADLKQFNDNRPV